jgi:hypothetical protein
MKKQLLLFVSAIAAFSASAQMSIPNGNFENWTSATMDYPSFYLQNSNMQTYSQCHVGFNVTKSTDAYHGSFAIQLATVSSGPDTCGAYFGNFDNGNGNPMSWTGGMPITQKPTGIRGYFKYNVASGDSALMIVVARAGGANIGTFIYKLGGLHSTYTLFNLPFPTALPSIPDSIIFAAASSDLTMNNNGIPGSILKLDSLSWVGITTQPAQMNGDFETWSTQTIETPDMWNTQNGGSNSFGAVAKTTDKVAGNYAIQLTTYLGDNNGVPRAQGAIASNGYWDNACSCQKGGYPFTNMIDTLVFTYKYAPADPTDSANVFVNFKSAGTNIGGNWISLHASASYQTVQLPINLSTAPDTAIIQIQSSNWPDSLLSFVGAVLKVDEMYFKSQPLATVIGSIHSNNDVSFYPNPFRSSGTIMISPEINTTGMIVTIYDVTGRTVKKITTNEHKITIDREEMLNGIYFYELKTNNNVIKTGKIVVE